MVGTKTVDELVCQVLIAAEQVRQKDKDNG